MKTKKGRVTLPSELNFYDETKIIMERWGADALRNSDGTALDDRLKDLDAKIYTTFFPSRGHNEHAKKHMDECPQVYLMSECVLAKNETLEIFYMEDYFQQQLQTNTKSDSKDYWQVFDRSTNTLIDSSLWSVDFNRDVVTIEGAIPFHEYTVSFLAFIIWDPVEMYNHITNDWGDKEHDIPYDIKQTNTNTFVYETMKTWLKDNPKTDVVRFTTFFYQFTLLFNKDAKEKFVDWFGYGSSVSIEMLASFEKEKGYALCAEDFVDEGYYNSTFRKPKQSYLDYVDFLSKFVSDEARKLVDLVRESGKESMMFLGDQWIGMEPYGPHFESIGLDAVVGSVGDGVTLRMISDIPNVSYHEGRFLPYFFPDSFHEGNDPSIELNDNWLKARRAIMRRPLDRIGYGGYLSLAYKFPKFVDSVEKITDEFRTIHDNIQGAQAYSGLKVAILNSWGSLRSWQTFIVAHGLYSKQAYSYYGVLESLSGMNVGVSFINFDDVLKGALEGLDVVINAGDRDTAFSGGSFWDDVNVVSTLKQWVDGGGGFVGIGEPSAYHKGGRYFQMADVLGVDKEQGFSVSTDKYFHEAVSSHFIKEGIETFDFGESCQSVYALNGNVDIIEYSNEEIHLSSQNYGKGRGVYLAGLPYSSTNSRLLMRILYHAAGKEARFTHWASSNTHVEVAAYPDSGRFAVLNNTHEQQTSVISQADGKSFMLTLAGGAIEWFDI